MSEQLKRRTAVAVAWSAMQSWGVKLFALAVFFVLARFLSPAELGLAQSVILILAFVAILSEQGFQDAIVQRKDLSHDDLNLPFAVSMFTAVSASAVLFFLSRDIADLLKVPDAASLIAISAVIPPLTAASIFEIAMRRRSMDFKTPARAALVAALISCSVALVMAMAGFGAASLIGQAIATAGITLLVLFRKPLWVPRGRIVFSTFKSILGYSTSAFGSRLLDFFSGKVVDLIILSKFGLGGLGVYAVGSKLYLTILQLLASTLIDVALSALSKMTGEQLRMKMAYLRLVFISSCTTLPLFVCVAALSDEICLLFFGDGWEGAGDVTRWLCLLGAIQVVQFFNSSVLGASGEAKKIFLLNMLKFVFGVSALLAADVQSISSVTLCFVISQLAVAPVSFYYGMRATGASVVDVLRNILPGGLSAVVAFGVAEGVRAHVVGLGGGLVSTLMGLFFVYVCAYFCFLMIFGARGVFQQIKYVSQTLSQ